MNLKPGYQQTDIGVIPADWELFTLSALTSEIGDGIHSTPIYSDNGEYFFINGNNIRDGRVVIAQDTKIVNYSEFKKYRKELGDRTILLSINGTIGNLGLYNGESVILGKSAAYLNIKNSIAKLFIYYYLQTDFVMRQFNDGLTGTTIKNLGLATIRSTQIPLPPTKAEQRAIAAALSDVDDLITALDTLIAKQRDIKQATMQQLLTGRTRLPGFAGAWEVKRLGDLINCFDNLRVPLNETQRLSMKGDYPYCGANGILDYIDKYLIDDDVILIAEDGGHFDEYEYRPIAYTMSGKFWVNNHAHVLKAKEGINQIFIFYSLVNKNILKYLASGTRAKLNKSELYKIEINIPSAYEEQTAIAAVLSDMDAQIESLERQRDKTRALKHGMMQELLTGNTRLL